MTIVLNTKGRLGNILFQYAALRNLSIKKNYNYFINTGIPFEILSRYFNIKNGSNYNQNEIINNYKSSDSNFFDNFFFDINDNTLIEGFFENIEYFKDNIDIIKNEIKIIDLEINNFTNNYINEITKNKYKIIGIHFRRGDMFDMFDKYGDIKCLFDKNTKSGYYELYNNFIKDYAKKVLNIIKKKEQYISIIVFTGGSLTNNYTHEDDISWVNNFIVQNNSEYNIFLSPGTLQNNEFLDYSLMSKCDYMIVPFQSTLSFMACYTSEKNIQIFSPTNLYGGVTIIEK